jgi:predicted metal-binding transcription factor (methanogenesis marker protein 9)
MSLLLEAAGAFEATAASTVRETILGGVAVLAIGVALWAILMLKRTQDLWLKDKDAQAARAEASNEKDRERSEKQTEAIRDLAQATRENTRAIDAQRISSDNMRSAIERQNDLLKFVLQKTADQFQGGQPTRGKP